MGKNVRVYVETDMELLDKDFFKSYDEMPYNVECHNGWAIAVRGINDKEELAEIKEGGAYYPKYVYMTYPKRAEVSAEEADDMVAYRFGDFSGEKLQYGDIMMLDGKCQFGAETLKELKAKIKEFNSKKAVVS